MKETSQEEPREKLLAELLEALAESRRHGKPPDIEAVTKENPDIADDLRDLWTTFVIAEEFSGKEGAAEAAEPSKARPGMPRVRDHDILEEIGRGGMGIVYRARQRSLDRLVALKVMAPGGFVSEGERARFRREAESAARLEHPHIAPVYEVGISGETPYFTMRLLEGKTLANVLFQGPLAPREAANLLFPVARAVEYAHTRGVLHRDLKPANILLDEGGRPYITDFGLAKRIEAGATLTQSGAILGTPSYMPPEQAAGSRGQVGPRSDVYSLGAILYQMLTGRPPFQAASPLDTLLSVLEEDPPLPRLLNPRADRDLELIALKCLQKPPDLRYASAGALADDLEAYLRGESLSVRSSGLRLLASRAFRETHHAAVLKNWGLLWMAHSVVLLVLCTATSSLKWSPAGKTIPGESPRRGQESHVHGHPPSRLPLERRLPSIG